MSNLVTLADHRPAAYVWQCTCGTMSFLLHRDGRIECCGCDAVQNTGAGTWILPEPKAAEVVPLNKTEEERRP